VQGSGSSLYAEEVAAMSGRVVHFEIPADDVARAEEFYRSAFGWNLSSMPDMGYTMVSTTPTDEQGAPKDPGAINGGMFKREGQLSTPVITIDVDDIDKALETVAANGGSTVQGKQPVMDMGYAAYFKDSEGNLMGLWQTAR
jgi:predicted enzyme related to lactoylglutathione lyase